MLITKNPNFPCVKPLKSLLLLFDFSLFKSHAAFPTWGGGVWSAEAAFVAGLGRVSCARCLFVLWNGFKHLRDSDTLQFFSSFSCYPGLPFDWANSWKAQKEAPSLCRPARTHEATPLTGGRWLIRCLCTRRHYYQQHGGGRRRAAQGDTML